MNDPVQFLRKADSHAYAVAALLALIYALSFMDRQVLSVLAEPIRKDLGLSDTQIGALGGVTFAVFYTVCGIPIGWVADRVRRTWIIAFACMVWSAFTMACGGATGFGSFALLRIGVATGEAGGSAPSLSLISDYFPPLRRGTGIAMFSAGAPIGATLGTMLGAAVAARHGWRTAFVVAGAPGLVAAIVLLLLVREPRRGRTDAAVAADPAPPLTTAIADYFADPVLRAVTLATTLSAFVAYGATAWMAPFFMRVRGMSLQEIAIYYGAGAGVIGTAGTFASGWLVDRLAARDARWYSWMPAIAYALVAPFWLAMLLLHDWRWSFAAAMAGSLALSFYLSPALAVVQNRTAPRQRTTSTAILLFVITLIGQGGGPIAIGIVSDRTKAAFGIRSLTIGLLMLVPIMLLASFAHVLAARRQATELSAAKGMNTAM